MKASAKGIAYLIKDIYLRYIAEQKPFVTVSHDLIVSPMKIWFITNVFPQNVMIQNLPSSSPLWSIKFNYASRNEEQSLRGIMRINDFAFFVFNYAIKHVDMSATKNKETGWYIYIYMLLTKWESERRKDWTHTRGVYTVNPRNCSYSLNNISRFKLVSDPTKLIIHDLLRQLLVI